MSYPRLALIVAIAALIGPESSRMRAQDPAPAPAPTPPQPAPPAADAKGDLDRLQGTWACVSWVYDGERDPDREQGFESSYAGNRITLRREGREYRHALITLDPARTPRAMNIWDQDGPAADRTNRGIYALEGGTLKLCIALDPEQDRPAEFTSVGGSRRLLLTYNRRQP